MLQRSPYSFAAMWRPISPVPTIRSMAGGPPSDRPISDLIVAVETFHPHFHWYNLLVGSRWCPSRIPRKVQESAMLPHSPSGLAAIPQLEWGSHVAHFFRSGNE